MRIGIFAAVLGLTVNAQAAQLSMRESSRMQEAAMVLKEIHGVPDKDIPSSRRDSADLASVVELVKDYAQQETLGPIKGAGKWLGMGAAGAALLGGGCVFLILGLLRMIQNEFGKSFQSPWVTMMPYAIALVATVLVMGFAAWRISKKKTLQKESR